MGTTVIRTMEPATIRPPRAETSAIHCAVLIACALLPGGSYADDKMSLGVAVGMGETDNVTRSATAAQSETIATVGADFEVKRDSRRLDLDARGDFNYFDYLRNTYSRQFLGRFDGQGTFAIVPERLTWMVQDDFGQAQVDPFAPVTPTNLENINVFATGPDLLLHFDANDFVRLGGRYSVMTYETSPLDGKRVLGNVGVGRDLSLASSVSLNADFERLTFDHAGAGGTTIITSGTNTDYDRRKVYARYDLKGARTDINASLGATQTNEGNGWTTTPLVRLDATRTVSASSTLQVTAGRQFTDVADSFRDLQGGAAGGIVIAPVVANSGNYLSNYASAAWRFQRLRTTLAVTANWERDTYTVHPEADVRRTDIELNAGRRLTSLLSVDLVGSVGKSNYLNQAFSDRNWLVGAAVTLRPGRHVDFRLRYDHDNRTTDGAGTGYSENRVFLTAGYRPFP